MNKLIIFTTALLDISTIVIWELLGSYVGAWDHDLISFFTAFAFGVGFTLAGRELYFFIKKR